MIGHFELAVASLLRGLGKLDVDAGRLAVDLEGAPEVLGEAVQTVLRRYGVMDAYERLKAASRGRAFTAADLAALVSSAKELPEPAKKALLALTPAAYVGDAEALARGFARSVLN
jgi:adenylosuccinate lyase